MMKKRVFLTGEWKNLVLLTWAVPPRLLQEDLPRGLELDLKDGNAFVSLVGFDFLNTKVFGIRWPGYQRFTEINLRYYVRRGEERGVVFVKELVRQRITVAVARLCYNEPYCRATMSSELARRDGLIHVEHRFTYKGTSNSFSVVARDEPWMAEEDSVEHFFKEHQWGYGRTRGSQSLQYEVGHPNWRTYPVESHELDVDFGKTYGEKWDFLSREVPFSRVLAEGSEIIVYRPVKL